MPLETFGSKVLAFYDALERFRWATPEVALLSPIADAERRAALERFCSKFYADVNNRVYWLGINPSRVRRTSTGVAYTDGFSLLEYCGIENDFDKGRELSSQFFYKFVMEYGGASAFYQKHFAGAAYPLSILRKDKYCNYYENGLPEEISGSVPEALKVQARFGNSRVLVIIGSGDNAKILRKLNDDLKLFDHVYVVEHPRYIMQYKSAELDFFMKKYSEVARSAEKDAGI